MISTTQIECLTGIKKNHEDFLNFTEPVPSPGTTGTERILCAFRPHSESAGRLCRGRPAEKIFRFFLHFNAIYVLLCTRSDDCFPASEQRTEKDGSIAQLVSST